MASTGVTSHLPQVKSVVVYRNGDPFFSGRRFVVNQKQISTMDALLNDITLNIGAPLAVRTLFTPRCGHRISDLTDLQQGAQYVAAGFERFKKLDYLNAGLKKSPTCRAAEQTKTLRLNVSAKWRKVIILPCIIHVFKNGDILSPAMRLIISRHLQKNLEQILRLISEKAMLRTGAVRRLCTLEGITVTSTEELESGQCYVAVGTEKFKKLPYVEILLNKTMGSSADRYYAGDRGLQRRMEDSHSDSTLLESPEREGRCVRSTGDEAERKSSPHPVKRKGRKGDKDENSVFYARPVRVRRHPPTSRHPPRPPGGPTDEPSVFKASDNSMREEVRGAEEVPEDENTAVELPVDQRAPETVKDEELHERDPFQTADINHMHSLEGHPSSPHLNENREKELSVSDRETQQGYTSRKHDRSTTRDSRSSRSSSLSDQQNEETQKELAGSFHEEELDGYAQHPLQTENDATE
ncbi:doublecortin domain-containing protein 2B isoform X2 [Triplophysa rosa]|uniref:doublecortin domain-containing protein 2B isoform X2 n=1 Tax=Triplophysa rosa TaxID=992332 RepID=UPI0025463187|nr:doublecortin domain-containing protein 2B isoform X2 [Triplophysa rosa]